MDAQNRSTKTKNRVVSTGIKITSRPGKSDPSNQKRIRSLSGITSDSFLEKRRKFSPEKSPKETAKKQIPYRCSQLPSQPKQKHAKEFKQKNKTFKAEGVKVTLPAPFKTRSAVNALIAQAEKCGLITKSIPPISTSTPLKTIHDCHEKAESVAEGFFTPMSQSMESIDQSQSSEREVTANSSAKNIKTKDASSKHQSTLDSYINSGAPPESDNAHSEADLEMQIDVEELNEGNPKTISVFSVMAMYKKMRSEIDELKGKPSDELKEQCAEYVFDQMSSTISEQEKKIEKLQQEVGHFRYKTKVLTEVVQRMHTDNEDIAQKIENLEMSNSRRQATITGFYASNEKDKCIQQLQELLFKALQLDIQLEDAYPIGFGKQKTYVMVFLSIADKRAVLENKSMLKYYSSQRIYINEHYPTATNERKRRERDIVKVNNDLSNPLDIDFKKGQLMIQNETYQKMVKAPTPEELIDIDLDDLDRILKLKPDKGDHITAQKSRFIAFSAKVSNHQQIRDYYIKMKLSYPHARHTVCAYNLAGEKWYNNRDYWDDGEPGAGRALLKLLTEYELEDRVVFVNRYYGGVKMGADRFACYSNATINLFTQTGCIASDTPYIQLRNIDTDPAPMQRNPPTPPRPHQNPLPRNEKPREQREVQRQTGHGARRYVQQSLSKARGSFSHNRGRRGYQAMRGSAYRGARPGTQQNTRWQTHSSPRLQSLNSNHHNHRENNQFQSNKHSPNNFFDESNSFTYLKKMMEPLRENQAQIYKFSNPQTVNSSPY